MSISFTIHHRTVNRSELLKFSSLEEVMMPTGKHWASGNRDSYYAKVAVMQAVDVEEVWDRARDQRWQEDIRITWHSHAHTRPIKCGDVIVDDRNNAWLVDRDGFTLIENDLASIAPVVTNTLAEAIVSHIQGLLKKCHYRHVLKRTWLNIIDNIYRNSTSDPEQPFFTEKGLRTIADQFGIL